MQQEIDAHVRAYYQYFISVDRLYDRWAKAQGLSFHALSILYAISEDPAHCTQKQIVERWQAPKQTVSTLLKGWEQAGYVTLSPCRHDKREKSIHLTAVGKAFSDRVLSALYEMEADAMREMGPEACAQMTRRNQEFLRCLQARMAEAQ